MSLQPTSELLQRHPELSSNKRLLIAGQLFDDYPLELAKISQQTTIVTTHAGIASRYQRQCSANTEILLSASPATLSNDYDCLLIYIPKAKQEADYWINALLPKIKTDGDVMIVGENRGGINAAPKLLKNYQLNAYKLDSARRCSLMYANRGEGIIEFDAEHWQTQYLLSLPQGELQVSSMPGVFNHGKLDAGTALLLEHLPPLMGKGLDFGCGAGIIGAALAKQTGAQISAVDVSVLATESTRRTFALNQLPADIYCCDGIDELQHDYDFIVSNPPFHLGVQTEYETSRQFIRLASEKLKSRGELWMVANSFLPYQELLTTYFTCCQIVTDNRKFRIYHCQKG
ncbi:methyltransferase [Celerinatantimonas sp. YJH-8]|uniref:methyltransferase n=1 Tax=Celerinatantimonas sp. YJH-8 TaxID=3228714 RepID=UPI0038BE399F